MSIFLKKAGILTTVQDLGRRGYRRFGINPGGAMDRTAARLINVLLGDEENQAVLEMHFPAPEIVFEKDMIFALGGADFAARLNGRELENWRPFLAAPGDVLDFPCKISGNRAYLSVQGGLAVEKWLGSASTNLRAGIGGLEGRKLVIGDRLRGRGQSRPAAPGNYKISHSLIPFYSRFPTVRVVASGEYDLLTPESRENFLRGDFVVSRHSDRMGFRLAGAPLELAENKEMISAGVDFGTIQLLPGGQLIVLMADHQTTGGYPRIAQLISNDLPLAAQLGAGEKIAFHQISTAEAEALWLDFEQNLNFLKTSCKFRIRNGFDRSQL